MVFMVNNEFYTDCEPSITSLPYNWKIIGQIKMPRKKKVSFEIASFLNLKANMKFEKLKIIKIKNVQCITRNKSAYSSGK